MRRASVRTVALGIIGFTLLTGAGFAALGLDPGRPHNAATGQGALSVQAASRPIRVRIPHLGLDEAIVSLGADRGTMELPPPTGVGWWTGSAAPGQRGVSLVTGFIRTQSGAPAAFARLRELRPHDLICFAMADGQRTSFVVTSIRAFPEGTLPPTQVLLGATEPTLKLVTTGGPLRPGDPNENVVVTGVPLGGQVIR